MSTTTTITLPLNECGMSRKDAARLIAQHLECDAQYAGTPTFAYHIGKLTLDADGTLTGPADQVTEAAALWTEDEADTEKEVSMEALSTEMGLTLRFPADSLSERTLAHLQALLAAKGPLIARALGIPATPFALDEVEGQLVFCLV